MTFDETVTPGTGLEPAERLINRELSWLDFNAPRTRPGARPGHPLLDRVRFCSIVSSNLDDFFMVRVAGLIARPGRASAVRSADGHTPQVALAEIHKRVLEQYAQQSALWNQELAPALEREGISIATIDACTEDELNELAGRFDREVYPVLTPLAVGPGQPFPYISGLSLSLGVLVRDRHTAEERFARVKVPEVLPRFVPVGDRGALVPLEEVIRHFASWLFPGMEILEQIVFRVTRDADFEVSDEADDLLEAVESELRRRRFGDAVRLEISSSVSEGCWSGWRTASGSTRARSTGSTACSTWPT